VQNFISFETLENTSKLRVVQRGNGKVKVVHMHAMKAYGGMEVYLYSLNIDTRLGDAQLHAPTDLPRGVRIEQYAG
jgi:hypothetical protein